MAIPKPPQTLYLIHNAREKAAYHTTLDCPTIVDMVRKRYGLPDTAKVSKEAREELFTAHRERRTWYTLQDNDRRYCRVCALEKISVGVLTRRRSEPTTFITISPWSAETWTVKPQARTLTMSETSAERNRRLCAALGYPTAETGIVGAEVMLADVPTRALGFIGRNFWAMTPPEGVEVTRDSAAVAWAMLVNELRLYAADRTPATQLWQVAHAACL